MVALAAGIPAALGTRVLGGSRAPLTSGFGFNRSDFEPFLNSQFRVHAGPGRTVEMSLVKITDLRRAVNKREREAFSLLFKGPAGSVSLPQETYLFEHRQMGKMNLFMVPALRKKQRGHYEVIVNRIQ